MRAAGTCLLATGGVIGLAGCPALLSDDFRIVADAGPADGAVDDSNPQAEAGGSSGGDGSGSSGGESATSVGDSSSDAETAPEAETGPVCVTDLSGVGTGDFTIAFTLTTTESGLYLALVNQRTAASCSANAPFWDVTIWPLGGIDVAMGDGINQAGVEAGNSVNDGAAHRVQDRATCGLALV